MAKMRAKELERDIKKHLKGDKKELKGMMWDDKTLMDKLGKRHKKEKGEKSERSEKRGMRGSSMR